MFRNGNAWDAYQQLERDFLEITNYVTLHPTHDNVYSEKLADLIIRTGGFVDTTFRHMIGYRGLDDQDGIEEKRRKVLKNQVTIEDYRECFEQYYHLSFLELDVRRNSYGKIRPFLDFATNVSPLWWKNYTKVKHDRFSNMNVATVWSSLESMGGLFLLNVFHMEGRDRLVDRGIIKSGYIVEDGVQSALAPAYLKELLGSDPRVIRSTKLVPIHALWAKTHLFLFRFPMTEGSTLKPFIVEE